ncbi:MAG: 6-phosphogluconolactonase [Hyphomonadaceae bacterium]
MRFCASPNARAQARRGAGHIAAILRQSVAARGRASLAVPGGDTPGPLFDALAHSAAPWPALTVTLTDERWVAPADPASNEGQVRARLLQGRASAAAFLPLHNDAPTPEAGRRRAQAGLRPLLPLDVCVLGTGEDGHIASLFPGADLAARAPLLAVEAPGARGAAARLSLSFRAIRTARTIFVLLRGHAKRRALAAHLAHNAALTPIQALIRNRRGGLWVLWAP